MRLKWFWILILFGFPNDTWGTSTWTQNLEFELGISGNVFNPNRSRLDPGFGFNTGFSVPVQKGQLSFQAVVLNGTSKESKNLIIDYGVLLLDVPYLYLYNLPVQAREEERHRLSGLKVSYWRNGGNLSEGRILSQYGLGFCLFFLESERRNNYQYPDFGPYNYLVNPHYQNSFLQNLYFIPGLSLGFKEKVYLGKRSAAKPRAALSWTVEYLFLKPLSKGPIMIQKFPVTNFNHLSVALGLHAHF